MDIRLNQNEKEDLKTSNKLDLVIIHLISANSFCLTSHRWTYVTSFLSFVLFYTINCISSYVFQMSFLFCSINGIPVVFASESLLSVSARVYCQCLIRREHLNLNTRDYEKGVGGENSKLFDRI